MPPDRTRHLTGCILLGIVASGLLAWSVHAHYSTGQILLALAIIWLGAAPSVIRTMDSNKGRFALFPVSCLFYAICFGMPVFLAPVIWPAEGRIGYYETTFAGISEIAPVPVLAVILVSLLAYIGAFYLARKFLIRMRYRFLVPHQYSDGRLRILLWGLLLCSLAYRFSPFLQSLPSIGQFLQPAGHVALAGFFILWSDSRLPRFEQVLVLAAIVLWFAQIIYGALLTPFLMVALLFFLLVIGFSRKAATVIALASVAFLLAGSLTSHIYRGYVARYLAAHQQQPSVGERLSTIGEALDRMAATPLITRDRKGNQGVISNVLRRISFLPLFTVVDRATPETVPYWAGETYRPLFTSIIPRALWPGKPEERAGRAIAVRYGLDAAEGSTSINVPWIVELLMNFGRTGVVAGMAVFGLFMAFLDRFFNRRDAAPLEGAIGLGMIFPLVYQESNFSLMVGSLLPLAVCMYLYFTIGLRWGAAKSRRPV